MRLKFVPSYWNFAFCISHTQFLIRNAWIAIISSACDNIYVYVFRIFEHIENAQINSTAGVSLAHRELWEWTKNRCKNVFILSAIHFGVSLPEAKKCVSGNMFMSDWQVLRFFPLLLYSSVACTLRQRVTFYCYPAHRHEGYKDWTRISPESVLNAEYSVSRFLMHFRSKDYMMPLMFLGDTPPRWRIKTKSCNERIAITGRHNTTISFHPSVWANWRSAMQYPIHKSSTRTNIMMAINNLSVKERQIQRPLTFHQFIVVPSLYCSFLAVMNRQFVILYAQLLFARKKRRICVSWFWGFRVRACIKTSHDGNKFSRKYSIIIFYLCELTRALLHSKALAEANVWISLDNLTYVWICHEWYEVCMFDWGETVEVATCVCLRDVHCVCVLLQPAIDGRDFYHIQIYQTVRAASVKRCVIL